ncbi:hypothetical protein MGG_03504 [Pyricularia oryzae 70-15]|uniref:Uncharacterized protein n=1 Tax=Pyricularia oryzae (strain 70-15 / ATCC MYA-4617 / FGSC 8958) TaxID=242507 RepID=G4N7Z6_PYRO7|nr:uncharacterized protein MGG_03504 [Pyricularia oryzae 70-15]EHA50098.1 hypothetical protein MGG_03504 [Pyricularia oryzae 70-15]KAI7927302.1 hypothetical protein M9X92_002283 [Pyricularia oryzae]KAI7927833.1 hypothetical protein M0657_002952 [Pyricularia oryzae]
MGPHRGLPWLRVPGYSLVIDIKLGFCPSPLSLLFRFYSSSIRFPVFNLFILSFQSAVHSSFADTPGANFNLSQKKNHSLSRLIRLYTLHTVKMQFTTSILSLITLAVSVSAHGHLAAPPALPNTTPFQNIRIPANGCGEGVKVDGAAVEATFKAGTTGKLTWNLNNGDGGGPLVVAFDTTGKGTSFNTKAVVTKNVEGVNGGVSRAVPRGDKPVEFTVPNVKCERCVLQIRQDLAGGKDGFGSCAIVSIV